MLAQSTKAYPWGMRPVGEVFQGIPGRPLGCSSSRGVSGVFWAWGLFLESPDSSPAPKSCFVFVVFAFKIKVSIILKIM